MEDPHGSDRPLWLVGLLIAVGFAWLGLCILWVPFAIVGPLCHHLGSPVFVVPGVLLVYALAPLVASFSALGRESWPLVNEDRSARKSALMLAIAAAVFTVLGVGEMVLFPDFDGWRHMLAGC